MNDILKKPESPKVTLKLASKSQKVESELGREFHRIIRRDLEEIDAYIKKHLHKLTCDQVKELYMALFGELKLWRSTSGGFEGFSEFLIFRIIYHMIEEKGEKFEQECEITEEPKKFKSESGRYEIGQSVLLKVDGENRKPDIYVKRNQEYVSIIQVKTYCGQGEKLFEREIGTLRLFRNVSKNVKGILISFTNAGAAVGKKPLSVENYRLLVLENEKNTKIADVLKEYI